jgi:hypothetical protein
VKDHGREQTRVIEGGKEDEARVSGDDGDRGHVWRRGDESEPWSRHVEAEVTAASITRGRGQARAHDADAHVQ